MVKGELNEESQAYEENDVSEDLPEALMLIIKQLSRRMAQQMSPKPVLIISPPPVPMAMSQPINDKDDDELSDEATAVNGNGRRFLVDMPLYNPYYYSYPPPPPYPYW